MEAQAAFFENLFKNKPVRFSLNNVKKLNNCKIP